ncbi:MAG: hypothetical protein ACJAZ9_000726 [Neolewinella sp.]|jgi:hypothetical protein
MQMLSFRSTTLFLSLLFLLNLSTCAPAQKSSKPTTNFTGTIRYQQPRQLLEANFRITPVDNTINVIYPTLFGTAMAPFEPTGPGNYRTRRNLPFPTTLQLTAPCSDGPNCPLSLNFQPPFSDSIPRELSKSQSAIFPVGTVGLTKAESLIIFFEPADHSTPRRIQLVGPTSTGNLTLRKEAISDIPAGEYLVYLVKQGVQKDSSAALVSSVQMEYFTKSKPVLVTE